MNEINNQLPLFLCGPVLRRLTCDRIVLWWVSPAEFSGRLDCYYPGCTDPFLSIALSSSNLKIFQFGVRAFVHLADIGKGCGLAGPGLENGKLPLDQKIEYNLVAECNDGKKTLTGLIPHITYPGERMPSFVVRKSVRRFFHGSCRKPHHDSEDAFLGLDREIRKTLDDMEYRPALLMLTGDQIYADDVAGPMLQAIHGVVRLLGLYEETFDGQAPVKDSAALYAHPDCYYMRKEIIPRTKVGEKWYRRGGGKHIFSSSFAHNHMITFAEWMAMYLLVWSPCLWEFIDFDPLKIPAQYKGRFEKEMACIQKFKNDLPKVQRLLAHIPVYMIFDDHDVTDDWNLTARWEQRAYSNAFTKRIIGNGLMAYFLCQGWRNAPHVFDDALIFKNAKTASHYVVISGDVHYSFAYDIELRFAENRPGIWQITSSGIKNEFPGSILHWIDRVNQIMYAPWSPLNIFTKRRDMTIHERIPKGKKKQRLINAAGIGRVTLDSNGAPVEIAEIYADKPPLFFESD